uniref:Uncharacterized protein n=1 Tax=Craspedostauros australis TaxID=1486917 RepID=A0A7S0F6P6_9STRA
MASTCSCTLQIIGSRPTMAKSHGMVCRSSHVLRKLVCLLVSLVAMGQTQLAVHRNGPAVSKLKYRCKDVSSRALTRIVSCGTMMACMVGLCRPLHAFGWSADDEVVS